MKVIGEIEDFHDNVVGLHDPHPFLNDLYYDVYFSDWEIKEWLANVMSENMCSQVDGDGYNMKILDSIVDYRKDSDAVDKAGMRFWTKIG